ncbi:hypothetical protein HUJ04_001645 [Dendroctonus ponderosae]|nr:hypothetical protein HUJ04_001645 [Dendroctonus ponderosae]
MDETVLEERVINKFPAPYCLESSPWLQPDFSYLTKKQCATFQDRRKITEEWLKISKVIILGDVAAGKTCLVNRWDTAGQERFKSIAQSYYRGANVILIVFDLSNFPSLFNCKKWFDEALGANSGSQPFVFLVGTKKDLVSNVCYKNIRADAVKLAKELNAEYWGVSSKSGKNVNKLFCRVAALSFDEIISKGFESDKRCIAIGDRLGGRCMTTLARWRAAQASETEKVKKRRPYLASECKSLYACEKWRMQIIREVAKKVAQIQNAGLGEFRIRDLNDEINKLLREKRHWEDQIKELGGPDYQKVGPRMLDHEGKEVPGNRGYKYFGAAKELPGVRELFEQEPPPPPRKTRAELMKDIDADYYGYMDDDDGILVPLELQAEKKAIKKAVAQWKTKKEARMETDASSEEEEEEVNIYASKETDETPQTMSQLVDGSQQRFVAHVPVPSQQDIEQALLRRRKQELLNKYGIAEEQ